MQIFISWMRASVLTLCGVWLVAGCQMTPAPQLVSCPLPTKDQVTAVLEVVPLGTSRDEVASKLKAAGILGSFNETRTIYYCDMWKRGETTRWHINVDLLFDEAGILYATRPDRDGRLVTSPQSDTSKVATERVPPVLNSPGNSPATDTATTEPSLYD